MTVERIGPLDPASNVKKSEKAAKNRDLERPLYLVFLLVVGLIISIFQAVTSINEATLSFVPKIVAVMVAIIIFFPWMMTYMTDFTREIFALIPAMRK